MNPLLPRRFFSRVPLLVAILGLPSLLGAAEIWRLDNLDQIGGHPVVVLGAPAIKEENGVKALVFDGAKDGIFIPAIPIAGAKQFTIEVLFYPAEGGLAQQRFFHLADRTQARAMFETRLDGKGQWWLDHFLFSRSTKSIVAIDPKLVHPTNQWYWVAMRWDGKTMTSFINGQKEMEREGAFGSFGEGQVSLGVRQTIEYWFKGGFAEVRFHQEALAPEKLQRR